MPQTLISVLPCALIRRALMVRHPIAVVYELIEISAWDRNQMSSALHGKRAVRVATRPTIPLNYVLVQPTAGQR